MMLTFMEKIENLSHYKCIISLIIESSIYVATRS